MSRTPEREVIVFGFMVGSWRLTLLPLANVGCCLMVSYAASYAFLEATGLTLPAYVPKVRRARTVEFEGKLPGRNARIRLRSDCGAREAEIGVAMRLS